MRPWRGEFHGESAGYLNVVHRPRHCAFTGRVSQLRGTSAIVRACRMCTPDMDVFVLHVAPARSAGSDYHESPAHLMRQYEMHQMHFVPLVRHQFVSREKARGEGDTGTAGALPSAARSAPPHPLHPPAHGCCPPPTPDPRHHDGRGAGAAGGQVCVGPALHGHARPQGPQVGPR